MRQVQATSIAVAGLLICTVIGVSAIDCHDGEESSPVVNATRTKGLASTLGKPSTSGKVEKATFGAGCFWGVEATFRRVEGVLETAVGFMGGTVENPTYHRVCTGKTGHAEVVHLTYDPSKVSYEQLLDVFWRCHDPTTLNRQGPDIGTQYRSVIFAHTDAQLAAATASKAALDKSGRFKRPIVTEIRPAGQFYRAEEYHQQYNEKHGFAACPTGH
jgi:peptide-methionine (S)-S-oxide reductase